MGSRILKQSTNHTYSNNTAPTSASSVLENIVVVLYIYLCYIIYSGVWATAGLPQPTKTALWKIKKYENGEFFFFQNFQYT